MTVLEIKQRLEPLNNRSAWKRGVKEYAIELLDNLEEQIDGGYLSNDIFQHTELLIKAMLNGAKNWSEYSYGACSLVYDGDICKRLCSPSEQKKYDNGRLGPNRYEMWLDIQAKALRQAANLINSVI